MASNRAKLNDPQTVSQIKNRSLTDTLPYLKIALTSDIRHYRGVVGLGISYGFMAPRTAEGDFKTPSSGLHYLFHHFYCIDQIFTLAKK